MVGMRTMVDVLDAVEFIEAQQQQWAGGDRYYLRHQYCHSKTADYPFIS